MRWLWFLLLLHIQKKKRYPVPMKKMKMKILFVQINEWLQQQWQRRRNSEYCGDIVQCTYMLCYSRHCIPIQCCSFQLFSWEKLYWEVKFCCVFLLWAKSKMGKNEISVFFIFLSNFSLRHSFLSVIVTITTSLPPRKFLKTYNENEKFLTDWSKKFL